MVAGAFYAFVIQRFKGGEVEDCSDNWSQQPRAGSALCTRMEMEVPVLDSGQQQLAAETQRRHEARIYRRFALAIMLIGLSIGFMNVMGWTKI
jgi:hypothetical protein